MSPFESFVAGLEARYRQKTPKSLALHGRAESVMVKGGSHAMRLFSPYPFFMARGEGAVVEDVDGNAYIDYWQGHYANVLGHNPAVLTDVLAAEGAGTLHSGFEGEGQVRLAEILLGRLGYDDYKIRFTTSGTLAAMYAVMLAMGFTGRERILKIGGGWHGASPFLLKGVKYHSGEGFQGADSAGLPEDLLARTDIIPWNDGDQLESVIREKGDRIAAFIIEPFLGAGGFLFADRAYLELARRLTAEKGIVLIFDEVISGFRFGPGAVQTLYGVKPDITLFGKVIGGGHAAAAVAGSARILDSCGDGAARGRRVAFDGGTFSAHPLAMRAGVAMIEWLVAQADEIYPRLGRIAERLRRGIVKAFEDEDFPVLVTGGGNETVPMSSMFMAHFPKRPIRGDRAEDLWDPSRCDIRLREEVLKLFLCLEGVHTTHGGGAVSAAHEDRQIERTIDAYRAAARAFKKNLSY